MIDIEALGSAETSVVLQIGACAFDREAGVIGATFEVTGDLFVQLDAGRTTDRDTIQWWKGQSREAWAAVSMGKSLPHEMCAGFLGWWDDQVKQHGEFTEVWAKGASYDFPILEHFLKKHGHVPWRYSAQRCLRTLINEDDRLKTLEPVREGTAHTGAADAVHQARWLLAIDAAKRPVAAESVVAESQPEGLPVR